MQNEKQWFANGQVGENPGNEVEWCEGKFAYHKALKKDPECPVTKLILTWLN